MAEWSLTNHGMRLLGFYSISSKFRGAKVVKQRRLAGWGWQMLLPSRAESSYSWDQGLPCDLFATAWLCYSTVFLGLNREQGIHQVTNGHLFL